MCVYAGLTESAGTRCACACAMGGTRTCVWACHMMSQAATTVSFRCTCGLLHVQLVSTSACNKVPINLASGCGAMRCELKTASGRPAVVVLGGQPSVLKVGRGEAKSRVAMGSSGAAGG